MALSIVYVILALLGLSFLIFIHEFGHYYAAIKQGMNVEVFSVGFGKPFLSWMRGKTKWQICLIPFGGYVKIAGMDGKEPRETEGGFYSKSPWARIVVVAMGPIVNIVCAFLLFTVIWMAGGRLKPFAEYTQIIGAVDPKSELYEKGIRAGDELTRLNGKSYDGFKDLIYASVVKNEKVDMSGYMVDYYAERRQPFNIHVKPVDDPRTASQDIRSLGILAPASYLLFQTGNDPDYSPLTKGAPLHGTGIAEGDRILWANGELIFSVQRLNQIMNEDTALVTIDRGGKHFLARIPRLPLADIQMTAGERGDIDDWKHEVGLKTETVNFIPYALDNELQVVRPYKYVDEGAHLGDLKGKARTSHLDVRLQAGDRILAVDGVPVSSGASFLETVQKKRVQLIVQKPQKDAAPISWKNEDAIFLQSVNWDHLSAIVRSMPYEPLSKAGDLLLLPPVAPEKMKNLPLPLERKQQLLAAYASQRKEAQKLTDPAKREQAMRFLEENEHRLVLGIAPKDRMVVYNPGPFALCGDILTQTGNTLSALFTGKLHPKWLSGPVGMIQIMHHGWSLGFKEALYWLATISLSLGIFNLFPLPVLDGGHICFALYEWITKRRVSTKVMERMIIPFVVVMLALFVYLTFHDLGRIVSIFK